MSRSLRFGVIVEGHGEVEAVPILLRRILQEQEPFLYLERCHPVRANRSSLVRDGELERLISLALRNIDFQGAILVLIDADDDLPCELGPRLAARARAVSRGLPVGVVIANREFEAWFLAGAASLCDKRGLPTGLQGPDDPESIRDAKGWLTSQMARGRAYSPTVDQAAFASELDLEQARRAPSFARCCREVRRLADAWFQTTPHNS